MGGEGEEEGVVSRPREVSSSSSSLSTHCHPSLHVVVVVVRGPFDLRRLRRRHLVGASWSLVIPRIHHRRLSSCVEGGRGGRPRGVIVIVRPLCPCVIVGRRTRWARASASAFGAIRKGRGGKASARESSSSSVPHVLVLSASSSSGGGVAVIVASSSSLVLEQLITAARYGERRSPG